MSPVASSIQQLPLQAVSVCDGERALPAASSYHSARHANRQPSTSNTAELAPDEQWPSKYIFTSVDVLVLPRPPFECNKLEFNHTFAWQSIVHSTTQNKQLRRNFGPRDCQLQLGPDRSVPGKLHFWFYESPFDALNPSS